MPTYQLFDTQTIIEPNNRNLWTIKSAFGPESLQEFKDLPLSHSAIWHRPPGCLEHRLQLHESSEFYPRLWPLAEQALPTVEKVVGIKLSVANVKVWLDLPYFHCPYHSDSAELIATMQIYLWSYGDDVTGTIFDHNEPIIKLPFVENTGYINYNIDQKIHNVHRIKGARLSIAFQYIAQSDVQGEM